MIEYIIGDATDPQIEDNYYNIIVHGCNNKGKWGKGFVVPLGKKFPEAKLAYLEWSYANKASYPNVAYPFELGEIQYVILPFNKNLHIVNMITQDGYLGDGQTIGAPAKLWAINKGFTIIRQFALDSKIASGLSTLIHMPRIGCGLGGLQWEDVEKEINKVFRFATSCIKIKVYDLEDKNGESKK